jgi:hypothetical protein
MGAGACDQGLLVEGFVDAVSQGNGRFGLLGKVLFTPAIELHASQQ